ncbi:MAG: prolyl oligopeptidase family serine peptidase [Arenimonas sp.]|uniref:S9 family peptidase n=1 Tax=Arenimonas sp. TaxID=1872635 RepID=UPI0025C4B604|nr:prolyl oligopeptidase family serine peptidase [Arenimonas sp.]MBW8368672.1 prolyl oligopeptidase family serine peptidase [Arenimonas sp.]
MRFVERLLPAVACFALAGTAGAGTLADPADALASLREAAAYERARPVAPRVPRAQLLATPQVQAVAMSPDGTQLAWLRARRDRREVWVQALPDGAPRLALPRTQAEQVAWSRDGRWLFLPEPRQLAVLAMAGQRGAGQVAVLGGVTRRQFLWLDPTQPAAALLLERPARTAGAGQPWRLVRVGVGGEETILHEDLRRIVDAAVAGDGTLAWLLLAEGEGHALYRATDPSPRQPVLRCERMRRCVLLGVAPGGGLWLWSNVDGDRSALLHLDGQGRVQRRHEDPRGEADLFDVTLDPVDGRPLFVAYRSTVPQLFALEPGDETRLNAIERQRPGRALQVTPGRERWLVQERSDTLRGDRWWLADARGRLTEALADAAFTFDAKTHPRPDEAVMARKWPMRWTASDGHVLHGFVTLPAGMDVATAPMVVSVHGGPFGLVRPDFSNDAQLLANRGYVVFQPNFRGSTGLGRDYVLASRGDFGNGRVQRDIVEGTRWLLANGIGDASRVGIVGASFGGYSALLGATFQPELFRVAVAGVPPADFSFVLRDYLGAGQEMLPGIPMAVSMRHLGLDPMDDALAARLAEQSPTANARLLRRPVLIVAGGQDERVPIRGITDYAARLRTLDKDVSLFVDDQADHGIADEHSREAYYFLMETLLHRQLGGAEPEPASAALRQHLQRHLRLTGPSLAN